LIERVTFFNDDTSFGVLQVKANGHRDLISVVGSLPSANPGEWVTAEGQWYAREPVWRRGGRCAAITGADPSLRFVNLVWTAAQFCADSTTCGGRA